MDVSAAPGTARTTVRASVASARRRARSGPSMTTARPAEEPGGDFGRRIDDGLREVEGRPGDRGLQPARQLVDEIGLGLAAWPHVIRREIEQELVAVRPERI